MESARTYRERSDWFRRHPIALRALLALNSLLTIIGYVAYPALLLLLAPFDLKLLLECIIVPGISFALVSFIRTRINAQRPYQAMSIRPLINKTTQGKSFPSRHTFCMIMIGLSWCLVDIWVGIALMISGVIMGIIRVIGGVHFPRDVIAGILSAIILGFIGYGICFLALP